MVERHLGIIPADADNGFSPQARGFEHICLVHAGDALVTLHGEVKRHTRNALNFGNGVLLGIPGSRLTAHFFSAALAEVDAAGQLAHNHNVHIVADNVVFNRRSALERSENHGRTQVGKQAQCAANAQKTCLGTVVAGLVVPLGTAHRAEQHAVGSLALCHGFFGKRHAGCVDCTAAEQRLVIGDGKTKLLRRLVEHLDSLIDDFGADAVAL